MILLSLVLLYVVAVRSDEHSRTLPSGPARTQRLFDARNTVEEHNTLIRLLVVCECTSRTKARSTKKTKAAAAAAAACDLAAAAAEDTARSVGRGCNSTGFCAAMAGSQIGHGKLQQLATPAGPENNGAIVWCCCRSSRGCGNK